MDSDGRALPDPGETAVLHRLGMLRSDQLPDIATRWLVADLADTDSIRVLAGQARGDRWTLEQLLMEVVAEANLTVPSTLAEKQRIVIDWISTNWRETGDIWRAVAALADLGEADPDFDLDIFIGMRDEWGTGWSRPEPALRADAVKELERFLHGEIKSDSPVASCVRATSPDETCPPRKQTPPT